MRARRWAQGSTASKPALKVAFAPRGQLDLAGFFREPAPELKIAAPSGAEPSPVPVAPGARGCGACAVGGGEGALLPCSMAALLALALRGRRGKRTR